MSTGGSREGPEGVRGAAGDVQGGGGRQAGRSWPPRPRVCEHAAAPTGRRKTTGKEAVVGWASWLGCQLCRPGGLHSR